MRLGSRNVEKIDIAHDFNILPSGRSLMDGHANATSFYMRIRSLLKDSTLVLDFNDTLSVGSSFIHELAKQAVRDKTDHDIVFTGDDVAKEKFERYVKEIKTKLEE